MPAANVRATSRTRPMNCSTCCALISNSLGGTMNTHTHSVEHFQHEHVYLGEHHERNERKTWTVIVLCSVMMVAEIGGGLMFGSMALLADGLHMSTHAGALLIAALAYTYARRHK